VEELIWELRTRLRVGPRVEETSTWPEPQVEPEVDTESDIPGPQAPSCAADVSDDGPYFVVWSVPGQLYEVRGIHSGRRGRAWAAIRRAIPGGRYRNGRDRLRGGYTSRAEARAAYFREAVWHQCPPGCAEWHW